MKSTLLKSILLLSCIGVVGTTGCSSTNTRSQNTAIGGVTGAVAGGLAGSLVGGGAGRAVAIGAGAIAGGLIGSNVGYSMDASDDEQMVYVMNTMPAHRVHHWTNRHSGATYEMVATSRHMKMRGQGDCRKFRTTAVIKGKKHVVYGTACRQANGTWKAI